jgi:hypothetical protein
LKVVFSRSTSCTICNLQLQLFLIGRLNSTTCFPTTTQIFLNFAGATLPCMIGSISWTSSTSESGLIPRHPKRTSLSRGQAGRRLACCLEIAVVDVDVRCHQCQNDAWVCVVAFRIYICNNVVVQYTWCALRFYVVGLGLWLYFGLYFVQIRTTLSTTFGCICTPKKIRRRRRSVRSILSQI